MANSTKASVPTRITTGKVRLTYAFIWEPRKPQDDQRKPDNDNDQDGNEKYSCCILIPKEDQRTLNKLQLALQYAVAAGEKKGYWQGSRLPSSFKSPLRDGDQECAEKGEEYAGHWFLNASSSRKPHIVDLNRNDIFDQSEVYSGCYARVCLNLYPFNKKGSRGIGCGLEAIQKVADGEPLGGVQVDIDEAFGDDEDMQAYGAMPQQGAGFVPQQGYVPQQVQTGYGNQRFQQGVVPQQSMNGHIPQQATQSFTPQQPGMMRPQGTPHHQQAPNYGMTQPQQGFYPQQMNGASNEFARGIENANSSLPPHLFEDPSNKQVA